MITFLSLDYWSMAFTGTLLIIFLDFYIPSFLLALLIVFINKKIGV